MKLIEKISKIKLKNRLIFLFILVATGLLITALIGFSHTQSMKKKLDTLYFGSLVKINELNTIKDAYQVDILNSINRAKRLQIELPLMFESTDRALKTIEKNWSEYASKYKKDEEIEYIEFVAKEIESINSEIRGLVLMLKDKKADIQKLNITSFDAKIEHINQIIDRLIGYKVQNARVDRGVFLDEYRVAMLKMATMLIALFLAVLAISFYIFKSIQKSQHSLHFMTTKLRLAKKKLENVTYIDTLSTLYNRRYFNIIYDREIKRAKRNKAYITFMMIDIDYFKQYNDTYGHIAGDKALRDVAIRLKDELKRASDYLFRLGGEEFGVLLLDTPEQNSLEVACRLNQAIKELGITHANSKVSSVVTISVGVASCIADDALDQKDLLSSADTMLYRAKEMGRDRCEITTDVRA
ncbi:MAG: diguanylate cyclase [Sulfurimonadaceae bacterium]|jgi:diguanylate cyclase (GGDEF)-like protein|nr:diguanylate cyclase [Sulfurimonadaceae bacterium]